MTSRRKVTVDQALEVLAAEWGEGWVLLPPTPAHIPRRPSLGGDVPTRRFYLRPVDGGADLGDVLLAHLPGEEG